MVTLHSMSQALALSQGPESRPWLRTPYRPMLVSSAITSPRFPLWLWLWVWELSWMLMRSVWWVHRTTKSPSFCRWWCCPLFRWWFWSRGDTKHLLCIKPSRREWITCGQCRLFSSTRAPSLFAMKMPLWSYESKQLNISKVCTTLGLFIEIYNVIKRCQMNWLLYIGLRCEWLFVFVCWPCN